VCAHVFVCVGVGVVKTRTTLTFYHGQDKISFFVIHCCEQQDSSLPALRCSPVSISQLTVVLQMYLTSYAWLHRGSGNSKPDPHNCLTGTSPVSHLPDTELNHSFIWCLHFQIFTKWNKCTHLFFLGGGTLCNPTGPQTHCAALTEPWMPHSAPPHSLSKHWANSCVTLCPAKYAWCVCVRVCVCVCVCVLGGDIFLL
jgi:hypothetical protein